jgi:glycosyltransferase involved in cell wall biosynthesis
MNNNSPTITTIICTYRRPKMLCRAIESVLSQTYQDFQICVYDNNSGDETAAIVDEFAKKDSRIKYHCHSENIGSTKNYLYAMNEVSTPIFSFLADDDLILPNFYSVAMAGFDKEPRALYSATSFLSLSLDGKRVCNVLFPSKVCYPPDGLFEFLESRTQPHLHAILMKKEILSECAAFNPYLWADLDFLYRVAAAHPVVISSEECFLSIVHDLDKNRKITIDHAWLEQETIAASLKPLLSEEEYQRLESIFDKKTRSVIYLLAIELIYANDLESAKIGADRLINKYGMYRQAFALKILVYIFSVFPFILSFLKSVRYLRLFPTSQEKHPILSYSQYMNIYQNKKY